MKMYPFDQITLDDLSPAERPARSHKQVICDHIEEALQAHGFQSIPEMMRSKSPASYTCAWDIYNKLAILGQGEMMRYTGYSYWQWWDKRQGIEGPTPLKKRGR